MAAQYADAVNFFESYGREKLTDILNTLREHCERLGRNFDDIEKTTLGTVHLTTGGDSVGSVLERLKTVSELGFTQAIFNLPNVYEITPLETFAKEIIPAAAEL